MNEEIPAIAWRYRVPFCAETDNKPEWLKKAIASGSVIIEPNGGPIKISCSWNPKTGERHIWFEGKLGDYVIKIGELLYILNTRIYADSHSSKEAA